MEAITGGWDPGLATGVRLIDADHQMLFEMIDALRTDPRPRELSNMIVALVRYAAEHFEREERLMDEYEYPGINAHKQLHARFREDMLAIRKTFALHPERIEPGKLADYLTRWLTGHIKGPDVALVHFLRGDDAILEGSPIGVRRPPDMRTDLEDVVAVEVQVVAACTGLVKRLAAMLNKDPTAAARLESILAGQPELSNEEAIGRVENILV